MKTLAIIILAGTLALASFLFLVANGWGPCFL